MKNEKEECLMTIKDGFLFAIGFMLGKLLFKLLISIITNVIIRLFDDYIIKNFNEYSPMVQEYILKMHPDIRRRVRTKPLVNKDKITIGFH